MMDRTNSLPSKTGSSSISLIPACGSSEIAMPLSYQRLERALRLDPLLDQVEDIFKDPTSDEASTSASDSSDEELPAAGATSEEIAMAAVEARREKIKLRRRFYNLSGLDGERKWLKDFLLDVSSDEDLSEDSGEEITEEEFQEMFRHHVRERRCREKWAKETQKSKFMYYSASAFRTGDEYHDNLARVRAVRFEPSTHSPPKSDKKRPKKDGSEIQSEEVPQEPRPAKEATKKQPREPKVDKKMTKKELKILEQVIAKRKKHFSILAKKEIPKASKTRLNIRKDGLNQCKKMAQMCQKYRRQQALTSVRGPGTITSFAKKMTREVMSFWKKNEKKEKELRKKAEKEEEVQKKRDMELLEVKRQQRKLNFLITQTELYAHFLSRKLGDQSSEAADGEQQILEEMEEKGVPRLAIDDYDADDAKQQIMSNVENALEEQKARMTKFKQPGAPSEGEPIRVIEQPEIFLGGLKGYQLDGLTWLANLYDEGISGILADEMGLGKTVQTIAFLAHLAEKYDIWGPFIVIAPASTLHNWAQEIVRFVPAFNVVPYWGSKHDRMVVRRIWLNNSTSMRESECHVLVTSYQLFVMDFKFIQKVKWQYMILDEAQAIKNSNSARWKTLLKCSCRNRLLLSGTPIQNSMAELWALLHFIMPTLFDSHKEFNEWFSKDVEGHAEKKSIMDAKHLKRLHMILKPFMLRRVKKEVQNELADKIELLVDCPLTGKQRRLYEQFKKRVKADVLVQDDDEDEQTKAAKKKTANLMNLVMQFRKACNHPELFGENEPVFPFYCGTHWVSLPKLVYDEAYSSSLEEKFKQELFDRRFSFASTALVHDALEKDPSSIFAFSKFIGFSVGEVASFFSRSWLNRWNHVVETSLKKELGDMNLLFHHDVPPEACEMLKIAHPRYVQWNDDNAAPLVFVKPTRPISSYMECIAHYVPESLKHRERRVRNFIRKEKLIRWERFMKVQAIEEEQQRTERRARGEFSEDEEEEKKKKRAVKRKSKGKKKSSKKKGDSVKEEENGAVLVKKEEDESMRELTCKVEVKLENEEDLQRPEMTLPWFDEKDIICVGCDPVDLQEEEKEKQLPDEIDVVEYIPHRKRPPKKYDLLLTEYPRFLCTDVLPKICSEGVRMHFSSSSHRYETFRLLNAGTVRLQRRDADVCALRYGSLRVREMAQRDAFRYSSLPTGVGGIEAVLPLRKGFTRASAPDWDAIVYDSGKMKILDVLLKRLKEEGHRVLIYSQMTRMLDIIEDVLHRRGHIYVRLDGSSRMEKRQEMVDRFQHDPVIFAFLLSTRAGGLGLNLTAADTVIFYDCDWNPTVDQQAMDRAHRLGQTKQVTVYRLICKGTIEERILQRAQEKSEIHRMVISGGSYEPDLASALQPQEMVSLLLDDEEMERKFLQRDSERKQLEEQKVEKRKKKTGGSSGTVKKENLTGSNPDFAGDAVPTIVGSSSAGRSTSSSVTKKRPPKAIKEPAAKKPKKSTTPRTKTPKTPRNQAPIRGHLEGPSKELVDTERPPSSESNSSVFTTTSAEVAIPVAVSKSSSKRRKTTESELGSDVEGESFFSPTPSKTAAKKAKTVSKKTPSSSARKSSSKAAKKLPPSPAPPLAPSPVPDGFDSPTSCSPTAMLTDPSGNRSGRRSNRSTGFYRQLHNGGRR